MKNLNLTLENITPNQAMALAQLIKRISFAELRQNASSEQEANLMLGAVSKLQDALAVAGYAPR